MKIKKDNIIYALSLIVSLFFQLLSSQVLLISALVFVVFLAGNLVFLWITEGKVTFKGLFRDPVLKSMGLFLTGAVLTAGFSYCKTEHIKRKDSRERKELLTEYISERILCDLTLGQLEQDGKEPSYAWCDSVGVVNEKSIYDLICGHYYLYSKKPDYQKARSYLKKASEVNPHAAYLYGECLYLGLGDISEKEKGLPLITWAAEKQILEAQFRLLGMSIISKNLTEAEKWYGRMVQARTEERVSVYFNNFLLVDPEDEDKAKRGQDAIENVLSHIFTLTFDAYELLYDLQIKGKKPYAAIKICEDYLSESSWFIADNDKKLETLINRLKYIAFIQTGNYIQARKVARSHSLGPLMPMKEDQELNLQYKLKVEFCLQQ